MGALIPILLSLLGNLPGVVGKIFQKQADTALAGLDLQKEIIKAQLMQAESMARAQIEYQTAALSSTTPLFKQHMFWFLSLPILLSLCFPLYAKEMWANLQLVPDYYKTLYSTIVLTIWGVPVASGWLSSMFSSLTSASADKRADKIKLETVSSDTYRKAFYDAFHSVGGRLNNNQVNDINEALDKLGTPKKIT